MEETRQSGEEMEAAVPAQVEESNFESPNAQGQQVPLSALQAERAERQRMQEELKLIKDHLSLMQASNQDKSHAQPKDELESLSDDDVLTVGEAKKFMQKMNSTYQMSIKELKMVQQHPDYQEVIQNHLPEVLKSNPSLRKTLEATQDFELAYYLAKNSDGYKEKHKKARKSQEAERILKNSEAAGNLSSMGASTPVGMVKNYSKMSDSEFRALMNRNLGYS